MSELRAFNPFKVAATAIEKEISIRNQKLKEQAEAESLSLDQSLLDDFYYQMGRAESKCELYRGNELKLAKKELAELKRKEKLMDNAWSEKRTALIFKWEDELKQLQRALVSINRLSQNHAALN